MTEHEAWNEVMSLAVKYGFIMQAYGGVAILATKENQLKSMGKEKYEVLHRGEERKDLQYESMAE